MNLIARFLTLIGARLYRIGDRLMWDRARTKTARSVLITWLRADDNATPEGPSGDSTYSGDSSDTDVDSDDETDIGDYHTSADRAARKMGNKKPSIRRTLLTWLSAPEYGEGGAKFFEGGNGAYSSLRVSKWAPCVCTRPSLKKPRWARSPSNTDTGAMLRAPHRLLIDQKIFRQAKGRLGASVLVDTSGSMGFSEAMIQEIVRRVPAATIALYAGTGGRGELRIVARNGLVADPSVIQGLGGTNEVDGPALRWLAQQPSPRIWISDGMVTGTGDRVAPNLDAEASQIVRDARIIRVREMESARKLVC